MRDLQVGRQRLRVEVSFVRLRRSFLGPGHVKRGGDGIMLPDALLPHLYQHLANELCMKKIGLEE